MSTIPTIEIGVPGDKVRVPRIGLGTMGMSPFYGATDDNESVKVLNHAIDIGCTFWDTADIYGAGHNERLLSQVLKTRRDEVFLCTKFGVVLREPKPGVKENFADLFIGICGKPEYVRTHVEASLNRLGVDRIDLYYQHRVDPSTPIEETVAAMAELVKMGKIRFIGLSECTAEELRRAYKVHPIAALEIEYSPWSTHIETSGLLDACRELGVTVVAYSPLGRGFMTGQIRSIDDLDEDDWRRTNPRFKPEHFANNLKLVDAFGSLAQKRGCKPGQIALAWLLAQDKNLAVIPGTKRIKYLDENFGSGQITLTSDEIKELREFVNAANIQGERY
ncbi:hypothetical protein GGI04_005825 [Coemansia thaxteri]|uniref:NADP-dependent oxidoreductase domain-containing protein n=1 Tax=Coemansia thaxteri TaxID=2663907 RepID=A0A9W8BIQ0_9FUNG|nr:hypothetical protein GGI04_005825 [Coemansia thaxteri]KAJ2002440.1 hypothetical protein H4R26_003602 [Coemansia thaxteri]KAJ2460036.1 hypothetical protein GGI02_005806 [Coemansia sp. RSA 2322]KAJ2482387.1 hypothetical protein EV174_003224 [Coemansia sp. RSA 2320]